MSRSSVPAKTNSRAYADSMEYAGVLLNTASPVPIPNTPSSLLPYVKPSPADRFDDSGPYKADMMARMEQMVRGDRIQPPCDRCRRLHMDCLKNLTACMGCTKKHAKCSWKEVEEQELKDHPFVPRIRTADDVAAAEVGSEGESIRSGGNRSGGEASRRERRRETTEVRDEELLGEESADEDEEMKDGPVAIHSPKPNDSNGPLSSILSPPETDTTAQSINQRKDDLDTSAGNPTKDETSSSAYRAPPAPMRRIPTDETAEPAEPNGHVQTEYEKDIYSQLHEATRAEAERRSSATATNPVNEPALRVYTAGSPPLEPFPPLVVSKEDETISLPIKNPSKEQQQPERQGSLPPPIQQEPSPTTIVQEKTSALKPQMPSPPLSGAPSHTTPTPVLEDQQQVVAPTPQMMQT